MENSTWLDLLFGGLALFILIGGLLMLFRGMLTMGNKQK
jgi:hypothetical protein